MKNYENQSLPSHLYYCININHVYNYNSKAQQSPEMPCESKDSKSCLLILLLLTAY